MLYGTIEEALLATTEAFSKDELAWLNEFEEDVELTKVVDALFPEPER
jgi:hypothetical protein